MFEVLQNEPYHWRRRITLALTTGLRRGELLGLEWKNIDLKTEVIDIRQSITVYEDGKNPLLKNQRQSKA